MADPLSLLNACDAEQVKLMEEQVILVDYNDRPIGAGSKKDTHIMTNINAGMLHRAFSVFLFTPEGKLILQQRSGTKITFPYIWANTCCSHPLSVPSEVIEEDAVGVINAARRKLEHELGIPPADVPASCFTWLTRVHYAGASQPAGGAAPFWGEHEIDWILVCTPRAHPRMDLNAGEVAAARAFSQPELRAWMAGRAARGEEVSPWFGVMEASGLLYRWWDAVLARDLAPVTQRGVIHRQHDLEAAAAGVPVASVPVHPALAASARVTRLLADQQAEGEDDEAEAAASPPPPSRGAGTGLAVVSSPPRSALRATDAGAASAGVGRASGGISASGAAAAAAAAARAVVPGASAAAPKQGAYGKVKVHSESLLAQLSHPDEVWAALCFKLGWSAATKVTPLPADASPSLVFCEALLCRVSRSFALVIQQLPPHLRTCVCAFYLVLRGLDTVEDDMEAFRAAPADKLRHLRGFHGYLADPQFCMHGVGEGDEAALLQQFFHVTRVFGELPAADRAVVADICARMGEGMAQFSGRDLREGTLDGADYGLYCHYVAGLVGEGLSRLFVAHGDEDEAVAADVKTADDMGRFLQKTNIIRDYLEDLVEGRAFWPRDIWALYAPGLANLRHKVDAAAVAAARAAAAGGRPVSAVDAGAMAEADAARACLNHMVADAMALAPSCLRYMARLRTPGVFSFCAVPQVMAVATLDKLADNADVFTGVVKIRKGQALQLMGAAGAGSMAAVYSVFLRHARSIRAKIPRRHAAAHALAAQACGEVEALCLAALGPGFASAGEGWLLAGLFSPAAVALAVAALAALLRHLYMRSRVAGWGDGSGAFLPRITDSWDVAALAAAVACVLYLVACAGVPVALGMASQQAAQPPAQQLAHPLKRVEGAASPWEAPSRSKSPRAAAAPASSRG